MYKMNKEEICDMVKGFTVHIQETASKIGEKSAFGFLYGDPDMTITAETVANEVAQFEATLRVYI
jgi:hypothetical protein